MIIGVIEILFGLITLFSVLVSIILRFNAKTPNVLFFVIVTASISTLLGVGILKFNTRAYQLLIYFSSVIILSKCMILLGIIQLNGSLETAVPVPIKSLISILYHGTVIFLLNKKNIRSIFIRP